MVDLYYPSENLNARNLLSVRHFVYKLLFHVNLPRFGDIIQRNGAEPGVIHRAVFCSNSVEVVGKNSSLWQTLQRRIMQMTITILTATFPMQNCAHMTITKICPL